MTALYIAAVQAVDYDDNFQSNTQYGGSSFVSSGSHSIMQGGGGNGVIISRRMGPNQEREDYISTISPKIIIDGDYCNFT